MSGTIKKYFLAGFVENGREDTGLRCYFISTYMDCMEIEIKELFTE